MLAGIVDLERYQKLHEKADTQRKALKAKLEAVEGQLTGVPEVTDFELLAAENKIVRRGASQGVRGEGSRAAAKPGVRRPGSGPTCRRGSPGCKSRWDKAQALIAESAAIEQAYFRLKELKDVIPHILVIQEKQLAMAESERNTRQLQALKEQTEAKRAEIEHALDVARQKRTSHQKSLMQEEQRLQEVGTRLRELSGHLTQVRMYEEQSAKLKQFAKDLERLPKDPAELVRQAQEVFDHRVELGKVVPLLDRFAAARLELRKATARGETSARSERTDAVRRASRRRSCTPT